MPDEINVEDWNANRKLVLATLTRIESKVDSVDANVDSKLREIEIDVAMLKTKWAIYAGIISVIVAAAVSYMVKHL